MKYKFYIHIKSGTRSFSDLTGYPNYYTDGFNSIEMLSGSGYDYYLNGKYYKKEEYYKKLNEIRNSYRLS